MKDEKPKLVKLLGTLRELREKEQAILDEIDVLLGGGVGIGEKLKHLYAMWSELWSARYHGPYVFAYVKDAPAFKRLLKTMAVEEIEARMVSYLRNGDEFYRARRHNLALFIGTVNQHAGIQVAELDGLEADAAATQRKRRELSR